MPEQSSVGGDCLSALRKQKGLNSKEEGLMPTTSQRLGQHAVLQLSVAGILLLFQPSKFPVVKIQEDGKDDTVGSRGGEASSGQGLRTSGVHFGQDEAGVSSITSTGSKGAASSGTTSRATTAASRAKGGGITQTVRDTF